MNAYCTQCGSQLPPGAAFCGTCGSHVPAPLAPATWPSERSQPTQQPTSTAAPSQHYGAVDQPVSAGWLLSGDGTPIFWDGAKWTLNQNEYHQLQSQETPFESLPARFTRPGLFTLPDGSSRYWDGERWAPTSRDPSTRVPAQAEPDRPITGGSRALKKGLMFGIPAGIAVLALCLVAAFQASKHKDEFTYSTSALTTVKVKVLVIDTLPYSTGTCHTGLTGYEDIHEGTVVTLSGDAGRTLGSAPLSVESGAGQGTCNFVAYVTGVPVDQHSYSVSGGGPQRGRITESGDRLSRDGWTFSLQW